MTEEAPPAAEEPTGEEKSPKHPVHAHTGRLWAETTAQMLALLAVLIPLEGAIVRFFALQFAGLDFPLDLPVRAPIGQLSVAGLNALVLALPFMAFYAFGWLITRTIQEDQTRWEHRPREYRARVSPLLRWALLLFALSFAGAIFLPGWPITAMLPILAAGTVAIQRELTLGRQITIRRLWFRVVYVTLFASILAGYAGDVAGSQPGRYVFTQDEQALMPNGIYTEVGSQDGLAYLVNCSDRYMVVGVPQSAIVQVKFPTSPASLGPLPPSQWDILTGHATFYPGLRLSC